MYWGMSLGKAATYLCESQKELLQCVQSTTSQYPSPAQGVDLSHGGLLDFCRNGHLLKTSVSSILHIFLIH
jgi:hypothetical protein